MTELTELTELGGRRIGAVWLRRVLAVLAVFGVAVLGSVHGEEKEREGVALVQTVISLPERWVMRELDSRWTFMPRGEQAVEGTRRAEERLEAMAMTVGEAGDGLPVRDPFF